jgi:choice-of-anchor A domain-containing protein
VTGNGGLNVIAINGDIQNTVILSGNSNDVFIVNVTGTADLSGSETLGLAGGVTANHVLYNFTGSGGSIDILSSGAVDGTLLAPHDDFILDGTFNGEIIGGGPEIILLPGATVNQDPFSAPATGPTGPIINE